MATITTKSPATATVTVVPGQNTTFSVTPSSNFLGATYTYQWLRGTNLIQGANSSSYFIDPLLPDDNTIFNVNLSAFNGGTLVDNVVAAASWTLLVKEDAPPFDKFDQGKETGRERHRRLRLLGYI